jgi:hypothetical protein
LPGHVVTLTPATQDKALAPLWFVSTTSDEAQANMKWAYYSVQMLDGIDWEGSPSLAMPAAKKRRKCSKIAEDLSSGVLQHTLLFPALVNVCVLEPGSELVCYKAAPVAKPKQTAAITIAKLAKAVVEASQARK